MPIHPSMYTDALPRRPSPSIPRPLESRPDRAQARLLLDIPAPFSESQARFILALKDLEVDRDGAFRLLRTSPAEFSQAQILCVQEILSLEARDFCATQADAMLPCALRGQLMRGRGFQDDEVCELERL